MSLTLRNIKGSELTFTEMDSNLTYLDDEITGHLSASDPHTQYHNNTRGDARYEPVITKSTGFAKWTGSAWAWDGNTYVKSTVTNTWTKAQRGAYVSLTSTSASTSIDLSLSNNYYHTLTENTTLAVPTNIVAGQSGVIEFKQHASSAKTLAVNAFWHMPSGWALTSTLNGKNLLTYVIDSLGTFAWCGWI